MGRGGKRVVLHVGAHKTGTTVFQQYLASHPQTLRRHRVRYVGRARLTPLIGWGERLVADPAGLRAVLDGFAGSRRDRVLLLSHENICGAPFSADRPGLYPDAAAPIAVLRGLLAPFDTTVLLTVRPPEELLESYYLQQVNLGSTADFGSWLAERDLQELSWRPYVDALRAAFARVVVADFGGIREGGAAYVGGLLARCGVALPRDETWERSHNPSVSELGLRLLLRGNELLAGPANASSRAAVRSFVQRHFSNADGARPQLLDATTRTMLRERYGEEYRELTSARAAIAVSP